MSYWKEIEEEEDIEYNEEDDSIEVLYETNDFGNCYVDIPMKFVKNLIIKNKIVINEKKISK